MLMILIMTCDSVKEYLMWDLFKDDTGMSQFAQNICLWLVIYIYNFLNHTHEGNDVKKLKKIGIN